VRRGSVQRPAVRAIAPPASLRSHHQRPSRQARATVYRLWVPTRLPVPPRNGCRRRHGPVGVEPATYGPDYTANLRGGERPITGINDGGRRIEQLFNWRLPIVVIIGDHGESMIEHDIFFDHYGLYESTLHIPLIVRAPGRLPAGSRLPFLLQNHDLAPTLLEGTGMAAPRTMDGQSFWKLLTGEAAHGGRDEIICCECTMQAQWCLRTRDHKLRKGSYRKCVDDLTLRAVGPRVSQDRQHS